MRPVYNVGQVQMSATVCEANTQGRFDGTVFRWLRFRPSEKKAHRRPDERVQSSQANRGCMLSGAWRVHPVIVGGSLERRLDEGASSPLIIHVFDVAD